MGATGITEKKIAEIRSERLGKEHLTARDVSNLVGQRKLVEARQSLIYHTAPSLFKEKLNAVIRILEQEFDGADMETKKNSLAFLAKLTIDLSLFLPQWNIKNGGLHGKAALSDVDVETITDQNKEAIFSWANRERALAESLLAEWVNENAFRFKIEGISDENEARKQAAKLVGNSILEYLNNMEASLKQSNLLHICGLRASGETRTEIGNDHSTNLEYAMWLGVSFVTTNPQLVEVAWELRPEHWTPRVDALIRSRYSLEEISEMLREDDQEGIARAIEKTNTDITMEVVAENANMLRGIFLLTEGQKGLVCLQVNPLKHAEADTMIREALYIYSKLTERFGGVPNVVFKLPATKAGLKAAEELTSRGIGVTITVSFGMFQSLPFAEVINRGQAISSNLVVMNGRLASPIVDELKDLGEDFARAGRWAGVAVAKRLHQKLYAPKEEGGCGYDPRKIKIVIASLRNYGGTFPDITELVGVSIITVFPDIRRAFDAEKRDIAPRKIEKPMDEETLRKLLRSELFRQAYFVPDDDENLKPSSPFRLEDTEKVLEYPSVKNTLGQFCEYRVKMGELVRKRVSTLCQPPPRR